MPTLTSTEADTLVGIFFDREQMRTTCPTSTRETRIGFLSTCCGLSLVYGTGSFMVILAHAAREKAFSTLLEPVCALYPRGSRLCRSLLHAVRTHVLNCALYDLNETTYQQHPQLPWFEAVSLDSNLPLVRGKEGLYLEVMVAAGGGWAKRFNDLIASP